MQYYAVGNRCAFDPVTLPEYDIEQSLKKLELACVHVDVVALARERIGRSRYVRGISADYAPGIVDCSSFVKWLYGEKGIWLPRRAIQQRDFGERVNTIVSGDLVFTSGYINLYHEDPDDGVGHVGLATGDGTVIHAAGQKEGIIETSLESFLGNRECRGIRRYAPASLLTVKLPHEHRVEYSEDLKWMILSRC